MPAKSVTAHPVPMLSPKEFRAQLADLGLRYAATTIHRWMRQGLIESIQPGPRRHRRIPPSEVVRIAGRGGAE